MPDMFGNDNQKTWQCFVCFMKFKGNSDGWDEFCEHMKNEHREMDDYLICPVKHCQAPIRDMIAHFKARHKGIPIPANTPLKALVWRDPKGTKKKKKHRFKSGDFISIKNNGATFVFRSSWELQMFNILENWGIVTKYEVETFKVKYYYRGRWRTYIADLKVEFADGHTEIFEVKPSNQTNMEINQAKWTAAKKLCENLGYRFEVITLERIKQLEQHILLEQRRRN